MITSKELLKEAYKLIKGGIARGAFAQNGNYESVHFTHLNAVRFCSLGALFRARYNLDSTMTDNDCRYLMREAIDLFKVISKSKKDMMVWHDSCNNEQIMQMWDKVVGLRWYQRLWLKLIRKFRKN